ncbi:SIMPL domain-containing protein [Bacillus subtilis]|uniref:SIMPL domain-containing protein n=1 Tax=Pseudochrobactrum asaccharolyticum TaxID=354351 RepID=UPI001F47EA45|nr:SIMPL domain-containing protein [Pseudochrobactrum asaccharolyticum]MCF7645163.1 SIMPL domain-containing protein [Pseudochrobactrum asaccharolyticum]MCF7671406.1 SIMPL domain-containing protein [Bacillus subtilis]
MTHRKTAALLASAFIAVSMAGALSQPAFAQEKNVSEKQQTFVVVTGEGEVQAAPDMAILDLSVLREAKTAREALTDNNKAMSKVLGAMKEAGIEDRDLQTSGVNIQPTYTYPNDKNGLKAPKIIGYNVTNGLTVRVRDLNKVGDLLDKSIDLGVNQSGGLRFVNDDPSKALMDARKKAMENAMEKAKILTETAGAKVGRVLEITEYVNNGRPMPMARTKMIAIAAEPASDSVPLSAGENSYNVNVTVKFEITQ